MKVALWLEHSFGAIFFQNMNTWVHDFVVRIEAMHLQYHLDVITSGRKSSKFSQRSKFFFRSALPMAIPYIRNTNPFCPVSANRSGWEEWKKKLIEYPTAKGGHQIGGTNPLPPTFSNFK
ncbi:hypothetical protein IE077_003220 [Cardiosporidium cionae]|uniref:Uncharacterized protein n=1 Tax=Cardiosporidium cionae TaxID=476202 RepID=A0ABQ7J8T8_9APIC|nr:hypothetical protein IE077_003220 [Cardiosporidium cionae]|eukprot:KAF8820392.1 hypothetical protein IE077_003220 [Cardiosporidium cionae]